MYDSISSLTGDEILIFMACYVMIGGFLKTLIMGNRKHNLFPLIWPYCIFLVIGAAPAAIIRVFFFGDDLSVKG